jgi:hypothetical protein
MPRTQRPSFLKRQKEQQRAAKAAQKREARRARRQAPAVDEDSIPDMEIEPVAEEQAPEA